MKVVRCVAVLIFLGLYRLSATTVVACITAKVVYLEIDSQVTFTGIGHGPAKKMCKLHHEGPIYFASAGPFLGREYSLLKTVKNAAAQGGGLAHIADRFQELAMEPLTEAMKHLLLIDRKGFDECCREKETPQVAFIAFQGGDDSCSNAHVPGSRC